MQQLSVAQIKDHRHANNDDWNMFSCENLTRHDINNIRMRDVDAAICNTSHQHIQTGSFLFAFCSSQLPMWFRVDPTLRAIQVISSRLLLITMSSQYRPVTKMICPTPQGACFWCLLVVAVSRVFCISNLRAQTGVRCLCRNVRRCRFRFCVFRCWSSGLRTLGLARCGHGAVSLTYRGSYYWRYIENQIQRGQINYGT